MEKAIGVVLDVSLLHEDDGRRRLDKVKDQLVKFIKECVDDGGDYFYLYHPETVEALIKNGEEVSAVSNYETDGWQFNLNYALKQTLYVIGAEDPDCDRTILLITDRMENVLAVKKSLMINDKDGYECSFLVVGIGLKYNRDKIEELENENDSLTHLHLDNSLFLAEALKTEIIDGR
jgi:hypothetical protein